MLFDHSVINVAMYKTQNKTIANHQSIKLVVHVYTYI